VPRHRQGPGWVGVDGGQFVLAGLRRRCAGQVLGRAVIEALAKTGTPPLARCPRLSLGRRAGMRERGGRLAAAAP
jgi:hypothetical protein